MHTRVHTPSAGVAPPRKAIGTRIVLSSSRKHGVHMEYHHVKDLQMPEHSPSSQGYHGDDEASNGSGEECPEIRAIRELLTALELKLRD